MRWFLTVLVAFAAVVMLCGSTSAGLIDILASQNTTNDTIADDSLGFITDVNTDSPNPSTPYVGDVAWGIVRVDNVNGNNSVQGTVYAVYSVTITDVSPPTIKHGVTNASGYTLKDLVGVPDDDTSLMAFLEWNGTGTNPFLNATNYPFETVNFMNRTESEFKADLNTLMSNSTVLFAVGLADNNDFLTATIVSPTLLTLSGGFSVTYAASGLNLSDFKALIGDPDHQAAIITGATQVLQSATFGAPGGSIKTRDQGNYELNYVPEPTSLVGLVGAGLAGLGLARFGRRRR